MILDNGCKLIFSLGEGSIRGKLKHLVSTLQQLWVAINTWNVIDKRELDALCKLQCELLTKNGRYGQLSSKATSSTMKKCKLVSRLEVIGENGAYVIYCFI